MRREHGDLTIGDVGVPVNYTTNEDMTGMNIDFKFTKPSGAVIVRDASSIATTVATYNTASGDIDEAGEWWIDLLNADNPFHYVGEGPMNFKVRPTPETMARL
jgi:hypothetical protein